MDFLHFVVLLGVIGIVLGFIWKWIGMLIILLLTLVTRRESIAVCLNNAILCYLITSLTCIATIIFIDQKESSLSVVLYSITGGFALWLLIARGAYENRKNYTAQFIRESIYRYDGLFIFGSLILYFIMLFIPSIGLNPLTLGIFGLVEWARKLPIIGWLIRLGGVLFMLNLGFYGLITTGLLGRYVFSKKAT